MYFFRGSPRLGYSFCWRFVHNRRALTQRPACADRTAAALFSRAAVDDRPPRMTLIAEPPDLFVAAYGQIGKFQRSVFLRVPLGFKRGDLHRQRVLRRFLASGAVRAAAARRTGVDLRLPTVTLGALPPYLLMTSEGNVGRGQTAVPRGISLTQQRVAAMLYAIRAQRHFHTCPPAAFCLCRVR